MQVVGIDLGTTNLRISTWDSEQPNTIPQPLTIGRGDSYTMPTVVAFRRQPSGEIETIVGEDADSLVEVPDQVVVVRNLKRYALAHDPYVSLHLKAWPPWWNQDSRCVQVWGQDYQVKDLISQMLKEAFQRAGLTLGFEWRAGCPVHAGFTYRSELAEVITELGGTGHGEVSKVVEEPLLLLALAHKLGTLEKGSYLVYDLGGGSFDCALAQIKETDDTNQMIIFGAGGDPAVGGSDIDDLLADDLDYADNPNLLRLAKEQVSPAEEQILPGGKTLDWEHYTAAVKKGGFVPKTFAAMRDSYVTAKVIWGRGEDNPPVGDIIQRNPTTGEVKFVWQLGWENLDEDVDGIILCGGPTKSPVFLENLKSRFGGSRIIPTSELIPPEIPDPVLTAISAGACFTVTGDYRPMYVNRLPVRIALKDLQTGEEVSYEPYEHFSSSPRQPFNDFVSRESLSENPEDPYSGARYELEVFSPSNILLRTKGLDGVERESQPVDPYINTRLVGSNLKLVINRLGQVGVQQSSENTAPQRFVVIANPSWQTEEQRAEETWREQVWNDVEERLKNYNSRPESSAGRQHISSITIDKEGWVISVT